MNPLRVLTLRGLGLVLFGAATVATGYQLGQRDFVVLGTLAFAIPLLGLLTVTGTPRRVAHTRALRPSRVPVGTEARMLLQLTNSSRVLPIGGLLGADSLPVILGQEPRFTVGYLGPRDVRDLGYRLRPQMRGHFRIGPLRLWFTDPLGCVRLPRTLGSSVSLLVTPSVVALPESPLTGGAATSHPVAGSGEDDVIPREYRHGDDPRRVHWRSTARHGQLMVRREEPRSRDRSEILLDTRTTAHAGVGPDSSVEVCVSAAASIALHLRERGHEVGVSTTADGEIANGPERAILDALALVRPVPPGKGNPTATPLSGGVPDLAASATSGRGMFVAVLGALDDADTATLVRARETSGRAHVAVLCDLAAWPGQDAPRRSEQALVSAGWTVLRVDSAHELARTWPHPPARPGSRGGDT
ncbi:DUF58 domain-containing protein [Halostreptopolyspora alba]|uniref:DUF58 domain-containing protein n=1 Tax=Halostreptopolyspora alba TaxID=2487137 RepID=A0A3N0EF33_9ACTN|nr:DUF58 domain-containing protein [Nocardiopsaceae bacterium YIM 96095]